jgi:predicted nucleic acid-binding protein
MSGRILLDNTVLVNFASVERPDLILDGAFDPVCTTPAVIAEYEAGAAAGRVPEDIWTSLPRVECTAEEDEFVRTLSDRLGAGERTCLAVAHHRNGLFASDDADARAAAHQHSIPVTGTLGILAASVQQGSLPRTQANTLLTEMIDAGYRSPLNRVDSLLD